MKPWSKTVHFYQFILVFWLVAAAACPAAAAAGKVALVIGNSDYKADPLPNPVNDAADMAGVLKKLGFEVILEKDADKADMVGSLRKFHKKVGTAEIGLFYYAGHGMQINGRNYLIPVRHAIAEEFEVESEAISADRILSAMESAGNPLNIVILDACRNNPFRSFRGAQKGLAEMKAPRGTIISYATSPGSLAEDGRGRNGTYTEALLKNFQDPGLDVQKMFNRTGLDVMEKTDGRQMPWVSTTPFPDYYLAGGAPEDQDLRLVPPQPATPQKAQLYVVTDPGGGQVRIMNIVDKYYDGIELDPGRYKLEGSMEGFRTKTRWITIDRVGDVDVTLTLAPEQSVPAVAAPAQTTSRTEPAVSRPAAASQASSPRAGDVWKEPVTGMEFVWVPGGCFMMGQTDSEKQYLIKDAGQETYDKYYKDELPRHEVCVDGFWMGKTEVTRGQFRQFIRSEGYKTDADKQGWAYVWKDGWQKESGANWEKTGYSQTDTHPVVNVSWNDAKAFIKWVSLKTGQKFVLPTEAQWEYAARGGTTGMRFWGSNDAEACKYANVADKGNWKPSFPCSDGYQFTAPVGNYSANPFGLHDMLGNVWEWCEDVFDSNAYSKHARNNPVITSGGSARVGRGGSWDYGPRYVRAANRDGFSADSRNGGLGFRLSLLQIRH